MLFQRQLQTLRPIVLASSSLRPAAAVTSFRRNFSSHTSVDIPVPGIDNPDTEISSVREITIGIVLGIISGLLWKQWQWEDKAVRDEFAAKLRRHQMKAGFAFDEDDD